MKTIACPSTMNSYYERNKPRILEGQMRRYAMSRGLNVEEFVRKWKEKKSWDTPESKTCRKCLQRKARSEFPAFKTSSDGLNCYCRKCKSAIDLAAHHVNRERTRARGRECYHRNKARYKPLMKQNQKKWRAANPAHVIAALHRRRALRIQAVGSFTSKQWRDLCDAAGGCCLCCGERRRLTADHVIPLSKGGSNDISNIQPLCQGCNSSKATKSTDYRLKMVA